MGLGEEFREQPVKKLALVIEFLGMMFLSAAFNLGLTTPEGISIYMVVVTLWGWGKGAGHFNPGITVAELFFHLDELAERLPFAILTVVAQLAGALAGIFLTYEVTYIQDIEDWSRFKTPDVAMMCPEEPGGDGVCPQGLQQQLFVTEFFVSIFFQATWLLIKNYDSARMGEMAEIHAFVKPILCSLAYLAPMMLFRGAVTNFSNPALAFEVWIWDWGFLSSERLTKDINSQTLYEADHAGRYIWIYICSPLFAAALAGRLANGHMRNLDGVPRDQPQLVLPDLASMQNSYMQDKTLSSNENKQDKSLAKKRTYSQKNHMSQAYRENLIQEHSRDQKAGEDTEIFEDKE